MAGLGRYITVLRLFTEQSSAWTVSALAERLNAPPSTLYRTVRDLTASGLMEQAGEASYRLGPAFIEYDRLLRLTDPLVRAGRPALHDIVVQAQTPCVAVLARLYNGGVMCVADEAAPATAFRPSYERGRLMPLTHGATSKVILANLPTRQLNKLIDNAPSIPGLRAELADIRKRGYCATASEIDAGLAGIAAPVVVKEAGVVASLTLVVSAATLDDNQRRRLVLLVVSAASLLAEDIRQTQSAPAGKLAARAQSS